MTKVDLAILEQILTSKFRVSIKLSNHAVERAIERKILLGTLVIGLSKVLRNKICEILYLVNSDKKVGIILDNKTSLVIKGKGNKLLVVTIVKGLNILVDEKFYAI